MKVKVIKDTGEYKKGEVHEVKKTSDGYMTISKTKNKMLAGMGFTHIFLPNQVKLIER